jgi:arylformamidase
MATIDLEAEYNNRARVPEHPQIFAQWERDAEDYRSQAMQERRAELGLAYGSSQRQFIDLFMPKPDAKAPLALFIHGGYWRSLDPSMFSHAARGSTRTGLQWRSPATISAPRSPSPRSSRQIRHACLFLWLRTHSAHHGLRPFRRGHLAGAMLATPWHCALSEDAGGSGARRVLDLGRVRSHAAGASPWRRTSASTRPRRARSRRSTGRRQRVACSMRSWGIESSEFLRESSEIARDMEHGRRADSIRGARRQNHFTAIDALSDPQSAMVTRLVELAKAAA